MPGITAEILSRQRARARRESLELALLQQFRAVSLSPERQVRVDKKRRWRFDFGFPEHRLLIEVHGGQWIGGRHTRGTGFDADCEKDAAAQVLGWRVLRVTGTHIHSGAALGWVQRLIADHSQVPPPT